MSPDRHHSQSDVENAEEDELDVDTAVLASPPEDARPPDPSTLLGFSLALDGLHRAMRDLTAAQVKLDSTIRGLEANGTLDQETMRLLRSVRDELQEITRIAYTNEGSLNAIYEVRDELRLIRATAYTSAHELELIRVAAETSAAALVAIQKTSADTGEVLGAIRDLLGAALDTHH